MPKSRNRQAAARKAAVTRKRKAAGKKAARTRSRRSAARKAAASRARRTAELAGGTQDQLKAPRPPLQHRITTGIAERDKKSLELTGKPLEGTELYSARLKVQGQERAKSGPIGRPRFRGSDHGWDRI